MSCTAWWDLLNIATSALTEQFATSAEVAGSARQPFAAAAASAWRCASVVPGGAASASAAAAGWLWLTSADIGPAMVASDCCGAGSSAAGRSTGFTVVGNASRSPLIATPTLCVAEVGQLPRSYRLGLAGKEGCRAGGTISGKLPASKAVTSVSGTSGTTPAVGGIAADSAAAAEA